MIKRFLIYVLLFSMIFLLAYIFTGIVYSAVMKNYKEPVGYRHTTLKVKVVPAPIVSVSYFEGSVAGLRVEDDNIYGSGFVKAIQPAVNPMAL